MKVSIEIPRPVERPHQAEVVKNLYWLDARIRRVAYKEGSDDVIHIEYDGDDFGEEKRSNVSETVVRIINAIDKIDIARIYENNLTPRFAKDPHPDLQINGWLKKLFNGGYAFSGLALQLTQGLDNAFRKYALRCQCEEYQYPGLTSYQTADRAGYLSGYPQNVNLVSHVHEDMESLRGYRLQSKNQQDDSDANRFLDSPDLICSPTICYHFWQSLADQQHTIPTLKTGTAIGACHRYESRAMTGLERLRQFSMREIFAIGAPDEVLKFRDHLLNGQKEFLDEFGIAAVIETASDPFFLDAYTEKRIYQVSLNLKYEVKATLPYKKQHLAISSVNYHETYFSKAFNITSEDNKALHSCCLGFGLERWCLAVFAQHGLNPDKWPTALIKCIENR